jgi:ABC-type transport system involved in multi-copper enzyme maturation permease subunit
LILITGAVLLLLPYLLNGFEVLFEGANSSKEFEGVFISSCLFSWLTVSLLAGNSIAGERADRSAEFIAYLPLPRWRMLVSKLALMLIVAVVFWSASLLAALVFVGPAELFASRFPKGLSFAAFIAINLVVTYGVGWLFSSLQKSPVLASVAGFVAGILTLGCAWGVGHVTMPEPSKYVPQSFESMAVNAFVWNTMIGLPIAIVCFCIGTWYFLRNSEPLTGIAS